MPPLSVRFGTQSKPHRIYDQLVSKEIAHPPGVVPVAKRSVTTSGRHYGSLSTITSCWVARNDQRAQRHRWLRGPWLETLGDSGGNLYHFLSGLCRARPNPNFGSVDSRCLAEIYFTCENHRRGNQLEGELMPSANTNRLNAFMRFCRYANAGVIILASLFFFILPGLIVIHQLTDASLRTAG